MPEPRSLAECKAEAGRAYGRFQAAPGEVEQLDVAVDAVRAAIELAPNDEERASLRTTLGVMLTDRYQVTGGPGDLEEGVWNYREAVALTGDASAGLARRVSNLGTGLFEHFIATGGSEVLREALAVAARALELTPADSPEWPARVLNWSAVQLEALGESPDDELLDQAIDTVRDAATALPASRASGQLNGNLATYLMRRYTTRRREEDLRDAIAGYRSALAIGVPRLYEPRIHSNLGNALWEAFLREGDGDADTLEQAVDEHRAAVAQTSPAQPARIDYLTNLGTSLADLARVTGNDDALEEGLHAWEQAWEWIDAFLGRSPVAHRLGLQDDLVRLSAQLVVALLDARDARPERALVLAEGSKARLIRQLLGWVELPAPDGVDAVVAARERALMRALAELDREELVDQELWPPARDAWSRATERAAQRASDLDELRGLWDRMAASGPAGEAFARFRRGAGRQPESYRGRADGTALLSVLITPEETVFFLVRPGATTPDVVRAPLGDDGWRTLAQRLYREIRTGRGADRGESWIAPLVPPFRQLRALVDGADRVVISPHRRAHLVPWAVVARRAGWTGPGGGPMPLAVVPALALVGPMSAVRVGERRAMVVGDPLGDLAHARAEAAAVAAELGVEDPLVGPKATLAAVTDELLAADVAHIAAHARFDSDSPLDSAIALADGDLTPRQILAERLHLDLLVLSACETAVGSPLAGDELMGVTQAFLSAGVRSMVVTLWPVNDTVTRSLMGTFYRELEHGRDRALAAAGAAVERVAPHPYYWGAFTLVGAWR